MREKRAYFLLAAAITVAVSFGVRQRALNKLRGATESLRQEGGVASAFATPPEVQSTNSVVGLTPDERSELIKLRGQILPLRGELADMSNRVAALTRPKPRRATGQIRETSLEQQAQMQATHAFMQSEAFTSAIRLGDALRKYLEEHGGELPDDLRQMEQMARFPLPAGVLQRFERMRTNTVPKEARSYTFIAREREARQLENGKWGRIYLRADGVVSLAGPVDKPDWPEWERFHEAMDKQQARKTQRATQR